VADAKDSIEGGSQVTVTAASGVTIGDLSGTSYGNGAVLPANSDEAFEVIGAGLVDQIMSAIGDYFEYVGAYQDTYGGLPTGVGNLSMTGSDEAASITATITGATFESGDVIDDGSDTYGWDGDTGHLTLSNVSFTASYSQLSDTAMRADANASLATGCTDLRYAVDETYVYDAGLGDYVFQPVYADYTIDTGLLNTNLKGSILMEEASDTAGSVTFNAAISLQSGAVISPVTTGGLGGKFIMTLAFASKATVDYSDDTSSGGVTISDDSIDFDLVVKVYDNTDTLVNTYTYTIDDLSSLGDESDFMFATIKKTAKKMTLSTIKR
jgi:hypothetical protein